MSGRFRVAPRTGKYYGTDILDGNRVLGAVWSHDENSQPSSRELLYMGITSKEEWLEYCCDYHWESEADYQEALRIVGILNELHQH